MGGEKTKISKKEVSGMVLILLTLFLIPVVCADVINPLISERNNTVNIAYDSSNRITNKTSTTGTITYSYDQQYQGTVSSVTAGAVNITYEYDDKLRVTKEIRTIDGMQFEKRYLYDSSDRVVSAEVHAEDIDYIYNLQGKIKQIPNYLTSAHYDAFGRVLNKTGTNGLVTTYTYNSQNNRLNRISIPSVVDLNYAYDAVGNIKQIDDALGNYDHVMSYDALDRLTTATVGPHRYVYNYNPIGNIMKIVHNDESKKFVYNNRTHFPSQIIEGSAGVDVYKVSQNDTHNKTRRVTFYLVNDKNSTLTGVNWTVSYGDGSSNSDFDLSIATSSFIQAQHAYTTAGNRYVNVTAKSPNITDNEMILLPFGVEANSLSRIYNKTSNQVIEFIGLNNLDESASNVSWTCLGLYANSTTTLNANQRMFVYVQYNASAGDFDTNCSITSLDGSGSIKDTFNVPGLSVENFGVVEQNASRRIVVYHTKNEYDNLTATIKSITDSDTIATTQSIPTDSFVMVITEVAYNSDGSDAFMVNASSGSASTRYNDLFSINGAVLLNYTRLSYGTLQEFIFYVKNRWLSGTTSWNAGSLSNSTSIAFNGTRIISTAQNYTTDGKKNLLLTAQRDTAVDNIRDSFNILPIQVISSDVSSGNQRAIQAYIIQNNLNTTQAVSWLLRSGEANVTSTQTLSIANRTFIFIETNYTSAGVYTIDFVINSTLFRDNQTGVVVS